METWDYVYTSHTRNFKLKPGDSFHCSRFTFLKPLCLHNVFTRHASLFIIHKKYYFCIMFYGNEKNV